MLSGEDGYSNEPLRIAQIIGKMWNGGVEAVVFNYYREIDKKKVQFDFFYDEDSTIEPPKELIEMGACFYKLPPYQKFWLYIPALTKLLKANSYKIVHSHLNTISVFPLLAARFANNPVRIAHNHSVPGGTEIGRNILKNILRIFSKSCATDYFACSEKAGRWMFGDKCFEQGNVRVVHNAIDFKRFQISEQKKEQIRDELELKGKLVIGHVGRFTFAKNHSFLFKVFSEVKRIRTEAVLLLVGDGELHIEIIKELKLLGLEDSVILVGQSFEPEKYYAIMNVVVVPSLYEGLSLTTIEAQLSGVPVIVSEAVPTEAIISKACYQMQLSQSASEWGKKIVEIVYSECQLMDEHLNYDITKEAPILMNWYIDKCNTMTKE